MICKCLHYNSAGSLVILETDCNTKNLVPLLDQLGYTTPQTFQKGMALIQGSLIIGVFTTPNQGAVYPS